MPQYLLSSISDLPNFKARSFTVETDNDSFGVLAIRHDDAISVYKNSCPHLNIPLNWQPDEFMSLEGTHIQCSTHGALFTIENGQCIAGPCRGQSLEQIAFVEKDEQIWLRL